LLGPRLGDELWSGLAVDGDELARWDDVSRRLRVPFLPNGLLAQFEGFEHLEELDLERYRKRYGNIGRLDLILEAEGDSTNRYQVSKQADVLMLFYLFTTEELDAVFARLSYRFDPTTIPATVDHYLERTTHGSTLSRVAHAWVLARTDRARSWRLFEEALGADLGDTQGRTTYAGVHLGAMAGSVDILERCYTGLEARDEVLWFNPQLPDELAHLEMELRYRDHVLTIHVDHHDLRLHSAPGPAQPIAVGIPPHHHELAPGQSLRIPLRRRTRHASGRALPATVNHAQRTGLHRPRAR
jgi:trehalose/maltose hydrolase-like predicted phosphorylase